MTDRARNESPSDNHGSDRAFIAMRLDAQLILTNADASMVEALPCGARRPCRAARHFHDRHFGHGADVARNEALPFRSRRRGADVEPNELLLRPNEVLLRLH